MEEEPSVDMDAMLDGFDPEGDVMDRRLLYEVTGLRMYKNEFRDEGSSEGENDLREYARPHLTDSLHSYNGLGLDDDGGLGSGSINN